MAKIHIIKRTPGHNETYDERKLYASIYAACLSQHTPTGEAELTANKVCKDIQPWLSDKPEIASSDLRRKASEYLKIYNPDAAYMYARHHKMAQR